MMSTRTCSLSLSTTGAPSMTVAANRYHWISSQALELVLRPKRTNALPAEISAAESTVNAATLPSWLLIQSIQSENLRSADKGESPDQMTKLCGPRGNPHKACDV